MYALNEILKGLIKGTNFIIILHFLNNFSGNKICDCFIFLLNMTEFITRDCRSMRNFRNLLWAVFYKWFSSIQISCKLFYWQICEVLRPMLWILQVDNIMRNTAWTRRKLNGPAVTNTTGARRRLTIQNFRPTTKVAPTGNNLSFLKLQSQMLNKKI